MPGFSGALGVGSGTSNSTTSSIDLSSRLIVNPTGDIFKSVSPKSSSIITNTNSLGLKTISGSNVTINYVNRNDVLIDPLVNLFQSFGLSLNVNNDVTFTGTTLGNGGYSNTAFSGMGVDKIIVIGVDNSQYGELIDGKTVKVELPTSAGTYTLYSSFLGGQQLNSVLDASYTDAAQATNRFGNNVAPMFCDAILKPNGGDASLSWATGYGLAKPFSLNGKKTYNLQTNANIGLTADTVVGMAYLDKGFIVITNPTIVNDALSSGTTLYSGITATTVMADSVSTSVSQMITCIADRLDQFKYWITGYGLSFRLGFKFTIIPLPLDT